MNAEQAWQSVLGQLQMEMPRASFETWVRDTRLITYEDGVITVGVRNQYACDWLESRLTSTTARLLCGMMDKTIDVRFVVDARPLDLENEPNEDVVALDDEGTEDAYVEMVGIDPLNEDLSDEELQMLGRELVVAGYTRRHVPESGVKELIFYACMRQAFYWAGETRRDGITKELRIATDDLVRWSIFPRSTWFRQVDKFDWDHDLAGLVERNIRMVDGKKKYDYQYYKMGNETRRRRLPNKYRVFVSPRLTRADAAQLFIHLKERSKQIELLSAIEELIQMDRKNLLAFLPPYGTKAPEGISGLDRMFYVADIVKILAGNDGALSQDLEKASITLNKAIIKLFGTMHVNHYFLYQIAPAYKLTPHQIWLQICSSDDSYNNEASGEYRDEVSYSYADLTAICGMADTSWKNIRAWLHPDQYPKLARGGDLSLFLRELAPAEQAVKIYGNEKDLKRKFQVRLSFDDLRVPIQVGLTESDSDGTYRKNDREEKAKSDSNGTNEKVIQMGLTECDSSETHIDDSNETNRPIQMGQTKSDSNGTDSVDSNGTKNLKSLISPKSPNKIISPTTHHADENERGWGVKPRWNLKTIFEINHVHPSVRQELSNKDVRDLVSWVLWAASPEGNKHEPFNFALAQLKTLDKSTGAGGLFDQLARELTPKEIIILIQATPKDTNEQFSKQKDYRNIAHGDLWRRIMVDGTGYNAKIEKVRLALFGTVNTNKLHSEKMFRGRSKALRRSPGK